MNNQEEIKWWKIIIYPIIGFFLFLLVIDLGIGLYLNFTCPNNIDYFVIHYPWGDWHVRNFCDHWPY